MGGAAPGGRVATAETLRVLDFPLLREAVAGQTQTPMGRRRLLALEPVAGLDELEERQGLVEDCRALLAERGSVPLGGAVPLDEILERARIGGTVLEPAALLEIAATAGVVRRVRARLDDDDRRWKRLAKVGARLPDLRRLIGQIEAVLDDDGEVRDEASPELGRLRKRQRRLRDRVVRTLDALVHSDDAGEALQDRLVTRRGGRFVIPVRADRRGSIRGVVHDTSSSGQTLYVEPLDVLDQQNDLAEVEHRVDKEVERLLSELTAHVRSAAPALQSAQTVLGELDALQGLARFADLTGSVRPRFVDEGLWLRGARHPLMLAATGVDVRTDGGLVGLEEARTNGPQEGGDPRRSGVGAHGRGGGVGPDGSSLSHDREPDDEAASFVPLDLELRPDQTVLVITGPNTGGKTVALKTVGVLTLMAQCGLPVPADEAHLPCRPRVHADIGDEQSIVANLSTFSAHLTRIDRFLRDCPEGSLVLLDELGTGTDPEEGAALGIALLERFAGLGAATLVSTHHDALKAFAHGFPAAVNAAMEFDSVTLRPTFRLRLGLPGRSNAFDIADRLGLAPQLVDRARSLLRRDTAELDSLLRSVEGEAEALAQDRLSLAEERRRLERELAEADAEADELRRQRDELRRQGQEAVREAVEEVRRRASEMLEELAGEIDSARSVADRRARWAARASELERRAVDDLKERLSGVEAGGPARAPSRPQESAPAPLQLDPDDDGSGELRRGDAVIVRPLDVRGTVGRDWSPQRDDPDEVEVEVRGKRLIVERTQVRKLVDRT